MSRVSKFLENELDRVNDYLGMAKANLVVPSELCEDNCASITKELSAHDIKVINYLNKELYELDAKINSARDIIQNFKKFYFNLQNK